MIFCWAGRQRRGRGKCGYVTQVTSNLRQPVFDKLTPVSGQ